MNIKFKYVVYIITLLSLSNPILHAQQFSLHRDTVRLTTEGSNTAQETIDISNYVINAADAAIEFDWRIINPEVLPEAWSYEGFCDNMLCYTSGWQSGAAKRSGSVMTADSSLFKLMLYIPKSAVSETAIFAFEVKTATLTDTAYFEVSKTAATNISNQKVKNNNVAVFPNPVDDLLTIESAIPFVKTILVSNFQGQLFTLPFNIFNKSIELNVADLPPGIYIFQLKDEKNNVRANGKFIKR